MHTVHCTYEEHAAQILDIFNEAILNSTALYDYKPRSIQNMETWFKVKTENQFPVIGVVDDHNVLLGFASYGPFRAWPAYKYTVEHSVYIHKDHRGKGIGKTLLEALISAATDQDYHLMIGGIDTTNLGSIALHKKLGFTHVGTINQVAFKFDRWLDLDFYQLILATPKNPVDG